MILRNHPLLSYRGLGSWPLIWIPIKLAYKNAAYLGCLFCSDVAFCFQVAAVLEDNRGRTIKEIGGLDFSFSL